MAEAAVELLLQVEVVEGLDKVVPVQVCVDAEDLQEDCAADANELAREAGTLADPVVVGWGGSFGGVGDARVLRGEEGCVVEFAGDPALHEGYILVGWELDWLVVLVQPGIRVVASE